MKKPNPHVIVILLLVLALVGFSIQVHAAEAKVNVGATIVRPGVVLTTGVAHDSNSMISQSASTSGPNGMVQVTIEFN